LAWTVEIGPRARKALRKLDRQIAARIIAFLDGIAAQDSDPRSRGKELVGEFGGFWRYRVGDYRLICSLDDGRLVVLVIDLGHRSDIYR
jgi:mRNA interferase RelE/StbE